ncbi:hypothetical protein IWQ47_001984 [Aquimarina sp. EL_43]|uniref:hypothetical protein n=1 Tax=unclassified Aquimarina TaxID=2627091 RepID=UPI0018C9455C|nr:MULTISPECIES: hypothetical protein [unclassified Aquimarina]MBG6129933.1 hypothetical protein [Aquimarina sp. EL_35]MBG6148713.1 hypothetical protein [Aquimarina sp. EL_32]MBG6168913.1 hypothetical protein [Aquimarina sp. EL_43]
MYKIPVKTILISILSIVSLYTLKAQTSSVQILQTARLPKDTTITKTLIDSFDGFLSLKEKPNNQNTFVLPQNLLATSALLDELKGIEKSNKFKDDNFYKCYVNNILKLNDTEYLIQFYYMGTYQNEPILRANYSILAQKRNYQFYFYSPLHQNTVSWQTKTIGNNTFYFKNNFEISKAIAYTSKIAEYDSILNIPKQSTKLYCAENFNEVLRLVGVDFKVDYNGYSHNTLISNDNTTNLIIDGILASNSEGFDPHDLWHSRVRKILPAKKIYKPVDEGCAFLFGGSWGYSWEEILQKFKRFIALNPDADWITLYNEGKNYGDETNKALRVDYTLNALLVKKINAEKGFSPILKLLSCGKKNEDYFPVLEEVTGITKNNFNQNIAKLIKQIK